MLTPVLEKLLILQDRDIRRRGVEAQLRAVPQEIALVEQKIAGEKAGIAKPSAPFVIGERSPRLVEVQHTGRVIRGLVFWVPTSGGLGLGISILSYNGEVRVGVATDSSLVPDPEGIVAGFEEELAFLEELAPSAPEPATAAAG